MTVEQRNEMATAEALRASEVRYRRLFESAKDGILILDAATGRVVEVNPFLIELLGFSREAFLGKKIWELGSFKDLAANETKFAELQAEDYVRYEDLPLETADGRRIAVEFVSNVYLINEQRVIQCSIRDITVRKRTEESLRASQQIVAGILDAIPVRVFWKDRQLVYLGCNAAFARDAGFADPKDIIGKDDYQMGWRDQAELYRSADRQVIESGDSKMLIEEPQQTSAGNTLTLLTSKLPLRNPKGEINGLLGTYLDITDRKRTEAALRESELFAQATLDALSAHIAVLDETGTIITVNRAWRAFAAANSPLTSNCNEGANYLAVCDAARGPAAEEAAAVAIGFRAVRSGAQSSFAIEYPCHAPETKRWFLCRLSRFPGPGSARFVVAHEDITARKQIEIILQESEERFRALAETVPAAIFIQTAGRFAYVNAALLRLFGAHRPEDLLGQLVLDRIQPAFRAQASQLILALNEKLAPVPEQDTVFLRMDGAPVQVSLSARPFKYQAANGALVLIGDISQRKQTEVALQGSTAKFRTMFEMSSFGMAECDLLTGQFLRVNQKYCGIIGYAAAELRQLRRTALVYPADRSQDAEANQQLVQGKVADYRTEQRYLRKDGTVVWLNVNRTVIRDGTGTPARTMATIEDITARKQVAESQARLAMAVEQSAEMIVITDATASVLYVNPAFEKITGYSSAEVLGHTPRMLKSGKHAAAFYRTMWAALTAGQVWHGHLINKHKNGTLIEEDITISPVFDTAGKVLNYVASKRDVTREVALEAQQRQTSKMAAVGQLAGGVAHDFNNKLQVIMGCVEMLLHEVRAEHPFHADLLEIQNATNRSADLTRQLLAFSRQQAIMPVLLDIQVAISGSLKMLSRLIGENIRLDFIAQPELARVLMDPGQLDQILVNMTVNARDAMTGTGHITIAITQRTLQVADCRDQIDFVPPGDYLVLAIRDDGAGMSQEIQAHIFEPFFTTKAVGKGTGMGLATVYGIVKQNHGAIAVQSAPGQGTTFSLYLPCSKAAALTTTGNTSGRMHAGTETVLVVEDEEILLKLARRMLAQQGYKVLAAATPRLALELCKDHPEPIDLLLTDVIMPKMSGKELAEHIQKLRPGIRVLYMSGYSADIMEQHGHLQASFQVLQKPFTTEALAQRVRATLDAPPAPPPL